LQDKVRSGKKKNDLLKERADYSSYSSLIFSYFNIYLESSLYFKPYQVI